MLFAELSKATALGTKWQLLPGFHVAKSVKLENLDKTPTLGEITGVLNQYYMNLQPK